MVRNASYRSWIEALEHDLAELHGFMQTERRLFAERMLELGAKGIRIEEKLREAYVKAGLPIPKPLGGRPSKSKHPLVRAVGNLRAWAAKVKEPYSTVKKWVYYGASPPEEWQERLLKDYGVPLTTWARVVKTRSSKPRKRKPKK